DLDAAGAEVVADHLESCEACRVDARSAGELRAFVQEHLGAEDEGEEETTAAAVSAIARRVLPPHVARPDVVSWWRRTWMATAALLVVALMVPAIFLSDLDASPAEVLEEAEERNRMWMYQPNKALQWEVETVAHGLKTVADGRWRTMFWRRNDATSFAEISRQINPGGELEFAYWHNADGSSVILRPKNNVIEITPSLAASREALSQLPAALREELERHLTLRTVNRSLDVERRRDMDRINGRSVWVSGGSATFSRGLLDRWGEVIHITLTKEDSLPPDIVRAVHEYDIDGSSFRLLRLKSTLTYADGTTGVHDSRWTAYREISPAEFAAQSPDAFLASGRPVVRLTPQDIAERIRKERSRK
ncbi:MAG TPA: hypothetical protein VNA04_00350, partial [Thermoanaerobaculia bacterium]|nr:hypothetical protein [Thermoanaerobaculia bacterium]